MKVHSYRTGFARTDETPLLVASERQVAQRDVRLFGQARRLNVSFHSLVELLLEKGRGSTNLPLQLWATTGGWQNWLTQMPRSRVVRMVTEQRHFIGPRGTVIARLLSCCCSGVPILTHETLSAARHSGTLRIGEMTLR